MVFSAFLPSSLSHLTRRTRKSCARVFSDIPSPSQAFEADLAASLQQLMQLGSDADHHSSTSDLLSLAWMCKALDVVLSAQSSAMQALSSAGGAHSHKLEVSRSTTEQYMEDSIKMLDVCGLVKKAMAGVDAYVKASHLALRRLQGLKLAHQGDIQRAKHALLSVRHVQDRVRASTHANVRSAKRPHLSMCSSMLRRMGNKIATPAPTDPLSFQEQSTASSALYGGEICAVFFLRLLSTALSSSPASHKGALTPLHISAQAAAWAPSLLSLQAQLNSELLQVAQKKSQRHGTLFSELHILEASMNQIYEALLKESSSKQADLQHLVDSASLLTNHLQSCMARLEHQTECLVSSLVHIRMELLK